MVRRTKGSGSVRERSPGVYRLRSYVGKDPLTGRPRYASRDVKAKNITAARAALSEFVAENRTEVLGSNASVATLMAEYIVYLETKRRAPLTIASARRTIDRVIVPALGDVPIGELESRHVDELIRKYAGLTPASVRRYVAVLSAGLGLAVKNGWIPSNPVSRASLPALGTAQPALPTLDEILQLIDAMPSNVWKMALRLAMLTGARRGELCALRWSDITTDEIRIRRSVYRLNGGNYEKTTKGGRERAVAIDPEVVPLLEAWAARCRAKADEAGVAVADDAFVLSTWPDSSRPLNPDTLSAHVTRAAKDLGIRHVHMHSIRHFASTEMLSAGVDVRQAADTLGHADGGKLLLQVYGHPTSDRQRSAAAAMARSLTARPAISP
jgi:integrase